jgi:hypothetical protein
MWQGKLYSAVRLYIVKVPKASSAGLSLAERSNCKLSGLESAQPLSIKFIVSQYVCKQASPLSPQQQAENGDKGLRAESHKQDGEDHFEADSIHHNCLPHYLFHCNGTCRCENLSFNVLTALHRIEWVFETSIKSHCLDDPHKQKGKTELDWQSHPIAGGLGVQLCVCFSSGGNSHCVESRR